MKEFNLVFFQCFFLPGLGDIDTASSKLRRGFVRFSGVDCKNMGIEFLKKSTRNIINDTQQLQRCYGSSATCRYFAQ